MAKVISAAAGVSLTAWLLTIPLLAHHSLTEYGANKPIHADGCRDRLNGPTRQLLPWTSPTNKARSRTEVRRFLDALYITGWKRQSR